MTLNSKKVAKKRGRPAKPKAQSFKRAGDADKLFANILTNELVLEQETKILNLEHQAIGYKAVISYLEHKLGIIK